MEQSRILMPTLKEAPSDAEAISHQMMVRAGYIYQVSAGVWAYLPLADRVIKKINQIIREEMDKIEAVEMMTPVLLPAELWQQSQRYESYGPNLFKLKDRKARDMILGPTHEETFTEIIRDSIHSYKKLPLVLYQIQDKLRDEDRPRYGILRGKEFIMKDAYSFDVDEEGLDLQYKAMYDAYSRIFSRCGLFFKPVEADSGAIGGSNSHEFMALAEAGEADVIHCKSCDYAANMEIGKPGIIKQNPEELKPLEEVATPAAKTIDAVAEALDLPLDKTIKAVVFNVDGKVVLAMVRGDHEVNEIAVQHAVEGTLEPEMASEEDLKRVGLVAGFISPVGLSQSDDLAIVVDQSIMEAYNLCGGANKVDAHYININPKRDFNVDDIIVAPIRLITADDVCPHCGGELYVNKGIEVGQVFKLGTKYSQALGATVLDAGGRPRPMVMGCYGIGVTRTLAAAIEQSHDEDGIIWPRAIAPFEVVIVPINAKDQALMDLSNDIYGILMQEGIESLLDDRKDRAGVKFKDADLIGYPLRITVSKNTLETKEVEIRIRKTGQAINVPVDQVGTKVLELLANL